MKDLLSKNPLKKVKKAGEAAGVPAEETPVPEPDYTGRIRRVKAVLVLVLCLSFGLSMLIRADFVRQRQLQICAMLSGDPEEKVRLYRESLYYGDSLSAEKGLVKAYDEAGRWEDAGALAERLLLDVPEDAWLSAYKQARTPAPPQVSMPGGTYDKDVSLQFSLADDGGPAYYGAVILCEQDGVPVEGDGLTLTENGSCRLTLQTRNAFGYSSPREEYTYVIDKLVPLPPEADTDSGYYLEPVQVSLSQPEGFSVYYTLDGTQPGPGSPRFSGPIVMEAGRTVLRAAACSPQGMMGEEREYYYHVRPWSSGSWEQGLITARGDYYCQGSVLKRCIDGQEAEGSISLSRRPSWICEYNDGFLMADGPELWYLGLEGQETVLLAQAPGDVTAVVPVEGDGFALLSGGRLYLLRDGQFEELAHTFYCICPSPDPALLYLGGTDGIYTLTVPEGSVEKMLHTEASVESVALGGGSLFYDLRGRSVFRYDLSTGQTETIREAVSRSYQEDPHMITNGYTETETISFGAVCYANGRLYYREKTIYERAEIPWAVPTQRKNQTSETTMVWTALHLETGKQETIDAPEIQLGNGYCRLPDSGSVVAQK